MHALDMCASYGPTLELSALAPPVFTRPDQVPWRKGLHPAFTMVTAHPGVQEGWEGQQPLQNAIKAAALSSSTAYRSSVHLNTGSIGAEQKITKC